MSDPIGVGPDHYDAAHTGAHDSPLMRRLAAEAMGDQFPAEVDPPSSCSWWLLGEPGRRAAAGGADPESRK